MPSRPGARRRTNLCSTRGADCTRRQAQAALTDPKALGGLLRAIDGFDGQPTTVAALKLMAYLFPRPGETAHGGME